MHFEDAIKGQKLLLETRKGKEMDFPPEIPAIIYPSQYLILVP
jgi:hypothetical protein